MRDLAWPLYRWWFAEVQCSGLAILRILGIEIGELLEQCNVAIGQCI